ncbi:hypothetical protein ACFOZ5_03490 [Marinobacter lacisalsi]|uniref:Secreted protein n=1 Tax=Marinobacter lacisalsi TaxID=475979 RepID=A0ABV8QEB7_9GAMM
MIAAVAVLLVVTAIVSPIALAESPELRLLPAARTFLTLQLCSSYSLEFEQNKALSERYSNRAWKLADAIAETGKGREDFPVALALAQDERRELAMRTSGTREEFKRRHQSGPPCNDALDHAQAMLGGTLLSPEGR